jgi:tRNA dimethylallyltransferase
MLEFSHIDNFLNTPSDKQKIIIIYWPTACGKTSLSIKVAKYLNSEVISADSQQIFKWLDIWTWKVTEKEADWIPHHMIDIINPDEEYSVWAYKKESEKIIKNLYNQNKIPIICGWTGLYIDSLIYDFNIPKLPADWELRDELEKQREEKWNDYIWEKLKEIDPEYAKTLHPNNHRYVIRWIEVKTLTWKSKLEFKSEKILKYDVLFITPYDWNREELYNKINFREKQIFEEGLLEETKNLLKKYSKNDFWMQSIGYKEMISYLEWEMSWEESIEELQKNARHYAKRQLTWFKKYK